MASIFNVIDFNPFCMQLITKNHNFHCEFTSSLFFMNKASCKMKKIHLYSHKSLWWTFSLVLYFCCYEYSPSLHLCCYQQIVDPVTIQSKTLDSFPKCRINFGQTTSLFMNTFLILLDVISFCHITGIKHQKMQSRLSHLDRNSAQMSHTDYEPSILVCILLIS